MRRLATVVATGGALLGAAPAAQAAHLTVDDNQAECPSAGFTTIQSAVDAAAAGDTISVCPGTYREGSNTQGSNAVDIRKPLTIKGAGANLVTVTPAEGATRIADPGASNSPRNGTGNVIGVVDPGGPVNISGVTVDGNDVFVDAGVVFLNASGSLTDSHVTNVIQTAGSGAFGASADPAVEALSQTGAGTTYTFNLADDLLDNYGTAGGALIDSRVAPGGSGALSGSVVEATVTGNTIRGAGPVGNVPQAQDGVQVSAGARATITGNTIVDHRFPPDNAQSDGVLVHDMATAAGYNATTVTGNNLQGNGYGLLVSGPNVPENPPAGTNVTASGNYWGNPAGPTPTAVTTTSADPPTRGDRVNDANVTYTPFRSTGVPVGTTPGLEPDTPPTVQITAPADDATVNPEPATVITADAGDDVGVKQVSFLRGGTPLGTDTTAPYSATYAPASGDAGTSQAITAIATDSRGQTTSTVIGVRVAGPATDATPSVAFTAPSAGDFLSRGAPTIVSFGASDDKGVKSVTLFVNGRRVCTDTTAPYSCAFTPTGADVGQVTLIAVVTDTSNQTAIAGLAVRVARFVPISLSARTTPGRDRRSPYRFRTSGGVSLPGSVSSAQGCGSGSVGVTYRGRRFTFTGVAKLSSQCTYTTRALVPRRGRVRVTASFLGNAILGERNATSQLVRAG